jgi:hypothetical protein
LQCGKETGTAEADRWNVYKIASKAVWLDDGFLVPWQEE